MNLYIADMHLGHEKAIIHDGRPFANAEEMDKCMIELWNRRVHKEDHVYIIGDFAFRNKKPFVWYLQQLKGHKHLIIGNHDNKLLQDEEAMKYFESVDKMLHVEDCGEHICLCHFPLAEWNGFYRGHKHIYGHIHNHDTDTAQFMRTRRNAYNAGCMFYGYEPVSLQELKKRAEQEETVC